MFPTFHGHIPWRLAAGIVLLAGRTALPAADLVDAHLTQARAVSVSTDTAAPEPLTRLKAELLAKADAWTSRPTRLTAAEDLLTGVPDAVRALARDTVADSAKAATALRDSVTLELLLALTAARNPDLRAAEQAWRASTRRFAQAWYLEELVGQYRAFARELETTVGPQTHKEMPGKTFAFPSVLALKGEIVEADVDLAWLRYRIAQRQALNSVAKGFFDIQYNDEATAILRETKTLFEQMEEGARAGLVAGKTSQAQVFNAQAELARVANRLAIREQQRAALLADVNASLGLPADSPWGPLAELDLKPGDMAPDEVYRLARAQRTELLAARREVELMRAMLRMAETEVLPRASMGYSQLAPSVGAEAGPTRSMMAAFPERQAVTAEQGEFGVNAAYLDELRVRVRQAEEMSAAAAADTERAVANALFAADTARRNLKTYGEAVVPPLREAFATLRSRYASGDETFLGFLDVGRGYLESVLMLAEARAEYNKAVVSIQDVQGQSAAGLLPTAERRTSGAAEYAPPK
ncbi:MAG: hypothetical protein A3K19_01565 [Lentisphaerae bacterium RIFOXYB12_FULL_65_16]|nr:MAG: hypothetical protein A3K18_02900 [Lentisphaerae bacterium RIFOXYA12_64_32]OGV92839.1 MAG: hypothetical protein A3K19_01565 [Lentisphaerae bacterium RIFOXYB12_FULL_65_16]